MAQTFSRPDEDIEKVLRRFKRQVKQEDIIGQTRSREAYEKPAEARKRIKREQVRQNKRRMRMEDW